MIKCLDAARPGIATDEVVVSGGRLLYVQSRTAMSWKATAYVAEITENITRSEKLLLLCLSNRYNDDERCAWISVPRLAKESLMSERTVHRSLESLVAKGFIAIGLRPGQSSVYLLTAMSAMPPTPAKLAGVNNWLGKIGHESPSL